MAGTEDSTPLEFAVALDEASYLQLDDVVVTLRHVPGVGPVADQRHRHAGAGQAGGRELRLRRLPHLRRRAARQDAGDRRGQHHAGGAGDLRAAAPGRGGPPRHRHRAGPGALLRPDDQPGPGGARPGRRADLRQHGVPRRHARRARVDQRHLRRGDEDQLRAVPAALHLPLRSAARARRQREGPGLQREGRGPALPRPAEHPPRRRPADPVRRSRAARRAVRVGRLLGAADPRRHDRPAERHGPHQRRRGVLVDDRRVLRAAAAALRVRRLRGRQAAVHDRDPPGRRPAAARRRALRKQRRREGRRRGRVAPTRTWST